MLTKWVVMRAAVARDEARLAGVDRPRLARGDARDRVLDGAARIDAAGEVATGAQRKHGEFGVAAEARAENARHHLARRSVAPGCDHQMGAGAHPFARDALGVARPARGRDVDRAEGVAQPGLDGRPVARRSRRHGSPDSRSRGCGPPRRRMLRGAFRDARAATIWYWRRTLAA